MPSILSLDSLDALSAPGAVRAFPAHAAPRLTPALTPALSVDRLTFRYGSVVALRDVSFSVAPGEILCVLGASGSGKSTLLRLVSGVERPSGGRIVLAGSEVAGPARFVEAEARRVGMVFQDYALFPHLSVAANVGFGLGRLAAAETKRRVSDLLHTVGLAGRASDYPHMLSGGERQRVALARALAPRPQLLLMDEPFSSLDGPLREAVRQQTVDILRDLQTTTVIVTHDAEEALRIADRIALLDRGRLVQCATPEDLYRRPADACAARVFGPVNELRGSCREGRVETAVGTFAAAHLPSRAAARVFIRPHHLRVSSGAGIPARVVRTTFLGHANHVLLEVPGAREPLIARVDAPARLDPETIVSVHVDPADAIVLRDPEAGISVN